MAVKTRERERIAPAPAGSAVEGLPGGLLRAGYHHRAALDRSQRGERSLARGLALIAFAEAFTSEQEDFGVLHQAVGNGRGNGGVVEDVAPVGERSVGGGRKLYSRAKARKRGWKRTRLPSCSATAVARLSYQSSRATPPIAWKAWRWQRTKVSKL